MYAARPRFPYRTVVPPSRLPRGRDLIWRHVARATGPANAPTTRATPCCTASLHPRRLRSRESWAAADAVGVAGARVTQEATVQRGRCVRRVAVPFADPHSGSSSRVGDRSNRRLRLGPRWTTSPRLELGAQRTNWKTSPIARPCNTQLPAALFRSLGFPRCRVSGRSRDHSCARVVQPACPADAVVDISRRCRVGVAGQVRKAGLEVAPAVALEAEAEQEQAEAEAEQAEAASDVGEAERVGVGGERTKRCLRTWRSPQAIPIGGERTPRTYLQVRLAVTTRLQGGHATRRVVCERGAGGALTRDGGTSHRLLGRGGVWQRATTGAWARTPPSPRSGSAPSTSP
jgi:hypothetical protein